MNATTKGIVSVILGIFGLFSAVWIDSFFSYSQRSNILVAIIIPLLICAIALYLGISARKDGAKIIGLIGIIFSGIGTLSHLLSLIGFGR